MGGRTQQWGVHDQFQGHVKDIFNDPWKNNGKIISKIIKFEIKGTLPLSASSEGKRPRSTNHCHFRYNTQSIDRSIKMTQMRLRRAASVSSIYMRDRGGLSKDTIQEEGKVTETMELLRKKMNKLTKIVTQLKHRMVRDKIFYKKRITLLKKKIKKHEEATLKQLQSLNQKTNKQLQQQRNLIERAVIESANEPTTNIVYDSTQVEDGDINVRLAQAQQDLETALEAETDRLRRLENNSKLNKSSAPPQPPLPPPPPTPLKAPALPALPTLSTDTPPPPMTATTPSPPTEQTITKSKTLIMTDSTCRNLRTNNLNTLINREREQIIVSKHPGATADQIHSYLDWWFTHEKPQALVVAAGANDLLYEDREARNRKEHLANEPQVVSKLMDIGREARDRGVSNIYFSGLYTIKSSFS